MGLVKTKLTGNNEVIPVVMFHSVGLENTDWVYSHISESLALFEAKIALLYRKGFRFIFWQELYDHMSGRKKLSTPSIMLTFDDGYLDNWIYAYPILKKYNAKATIFINPEFVDPSTSPRPNLEHMQEQNEKTELDDTAAGFLNWPEIKQMINSGLIDIQSHSLTHTWYYSGPKLLDFHRPWSKKYPWLAWNIHPEKKYRYMQENYMNWVPWGTPVLEHEKSLVCRKYYPPEDVVEGLVNHVQDHGRKGFFDAPDWADTLNTLFEDLMARHKDKGRYESKEAYEARIFFELKESKRIIEEYLNKPVDFLCFPGGGYNQTVLSLAKEAGYTGWTLASKDKSGFRNMPGANPMQIKRIGAFSKYRFHGKIYGTAGSRYFLNALKQHQGSFFHKWIARTQLVYTMISSVLGRNRSA